MPAFVIMASNRGAIWWQHVKPQEVVIGSRSKARKRLKEYQSKSTNNFWLEPVKLSKE